MAEAVAGVIRYQCVAKRHLSPDRPDQGAVTIHDGGWAYCQDHAVGTAHQWIPTGGIALEMLLYRLRTPRLTETIS